MGPDGRADKILEHVLSTIQSSRKNLSSQGDLRKSSSTVSSGLDRVHFSFVCGSGSGVLGEGLELTDSARLLALESRDLVLGLQMWAIVL